jgi:CRISPR/Cas system-associated endoribonuclease Cas2
LSLSAAAQANAGKVPVSHWQSPAPAQKNSNNSKPAAGPTRKMGEWLQNHKDLPPDQQQKLLENDPAFKKLSPQRQAELRDRLKKFNSLTPQQRERAMQRMAFMAKLTPEQRQKLRDANQQLQGLPQERRVMVHTALRHLRQMDPQQQQQTLQSDHFRSTFSDQEQKIIGELTVINPPESPK